MKVPALLVEYTADNVVYPSDLREIFSSLGTTDKHHERVRGGHFGRGDTARGDAAALIFDWLAQRV